MESERPRLTPLTVDQPSSRIIPSGLERQPLDPLPPELRDKAARIVTLEEALRESDERLLSELRDSALDPDGPYFSPDADAYARWLASEEADEFALAIEQVLGPQAVASLDL
jgi:hypothetical protein